MIRAVLVLDADDVPGARFDVQIIEIAVGGVFIAASGGGPTVPLLIEAAHDQPDPVTGAVVRVHLPAPGDGPADHGQNGHGGLHDTTTNWNPTTDTAPDERRPPPSG